MKSTNKKEKQPLVAIRNLSAYYDKKRVIEKADLTIHNNDFLGIIGPNGGGKTTFIRCILGLHTEYEGTIQFYKEGKESTGLTLGYLPQHHNLDKKFPITVFQVIASGLNSKISLTGRLQPHHKERIEEIIHDVGLENYKSQSIGRLSGGQIQRALLGRALVSNPDLLILDEPSTYIDSEFETRLYDLLQDINKQCAIILVSHDIGTVLQQVKSIACINQKLDYHPDTEISNEWLEKNYHCPIELLGHGNIPHRVLKKHS
ncbi:MAG: metal ABC transporter ATP-binding protein [Bacteroidales bacterium]|nr:metal ABC transporter ATP-binding protein [Bacteroidales bacterium]